MDKKTDPPRLDRHDLKILRALAANGRLSGRDLAQSVGLSLTPTLRRLRRLEEEKFILGYIAQLNEARIAGSISVFVAVTLEKQSEALLVEFEREIAKCPEVMSCFLMTGGTDYNLRVVVRDLAEYHAFLTGSLTRIPGVAHVRTSFSLKTVLMRTSPAL